MTEEQAIALGKTRWWESLSSTDVVEFQLFQPRLCMPFGVFHAAVEKVLERPVYTHEFGLNIEGLRKEFLGERPPPTLQEILALLPKDKLILIGL